MASRQFISDATFNSTLRAVRRAIGDSGGAQQIIQTVHRYGYRCVATVTIRAEKESQPAIEAESVSALAAPLPLLVAGVERTSDPGYSASVAVQQFATIPKSSHGERKFVTILCCGLGNTSDFLRQHSLDALHSLMNALYARARNVVQQYGGMFQPAMGDGVLIVFGAPIAQEDHAVRAALAALELRQQLNEWLHVAGARIGITLAVRIGLHTGLIAVGGLGEEPELTTALVGDVAAKAVALQAQAEPETSLAVMRPSAWCGGLSLWKRLLWPQRPDCGSSAIKSLAGGRDARSPSSMPCAP